MKGDKSDTLALQSNLLQIVRIALGTQENLSHTLSPDEWEALYTECKRHTVEGLCLQAFEYADAKKQSWNIPDDLRLRWLNRGEKIVRRNQNHLSQCQRLNEKLTKDAHEHLFLKGQTVAHLYPHPEWRSCGDIDVWIVERRKDLVRMARRVTHRREEVEYHHMLFRVFTDTPVELHFHPSWMFNPLHNRRIQNWFNAHRKSTSVAQLPAPTLGFNVIYLLLHIYRHLFDEGVGLRQIVDYFYVLKTAQGNIKPSLKQFGLEDFAKALMWLMVEALKMPKSWTICEPDEKMGRWLLNEVILAGNFGFSDARFTHIKHRTRLQRLFWRMRLSMRRISTFPQEALFEMPWRISHYVWRLLNGYL